MSNERIESDLNPREVGKECNENTRMTPLITHYPQRYPQTTKIQEKSINRFGAPSILFSRERQLFFPPKSVLPLQQRNSSTTQFKQRNEQRNQDATAMTNQKRPRTYTTWTQLIENYNPHAFPTKTNTITGMTSSPSLTLIPSGEREVVDENRATEIIAEWDQQLTALVEGPPSSPSPLVHAIDLSNKSYTAEAALLIADFLTSEQTYQPCLASGITVANLNDMIASRMEEEGLQVLTTISNIFSSAKLTKVDLSDNAMGSKGLQACSMVLGGQRGTLAALSMCNCGLSKYTMAEIADICIEKDEEGNCIAQNLHSIEFYNNMSDDDGCDSFARIMAQATQKLTHIRYSSTRAKKNGSASISAALVDLAERNCLENVVHLDLADNSFGECYEALAQALVACPNLSYLNVKDCMMEDEGTDVVLSSLMDSGCPLVLLDVSGNELTAEGATKVGEMIGALSASLECFHASDNEMTSAGLKVLAKAIPSGAVLREINLSCNECGTIGGKALIQCEKRLPNLEKIELDGNFFLEDMVSQLETVFGSRLLHMEDNIDDDDIDAENGIEEADSDENVDALTKALGDKLTV